jgi:phosphatidylinositol-bisphosphatase
MASSDSDAPSVDGDELGTDTETELDSQGGDTARRFQVEPHHARPAETAPLTGGSPSPADQSIPRELGAGEAVEFSTELAPMAEPPLLDECGRVCEPRGCLKLCPNDVLLAVQGIPLLPHTSLSPNELLASMALNARHRALQLRVRRVSRVAALYPEPPHGLEIHAGGGARDEGQPRSAERQTGRLRVCCVTWNMHGKEPPPTLPELLQHRPAVQYDLFAIGSQEAERSIEASMLNSSKARWEGTLGKTLGPGFVLIAAHVLAAMHVAIFARVELAPRISGVRTGQVATGVANTLGNKGGVGVSLLVGHTSFCFVSCHFTAHQAAVRARNADMRRIDESLDLWPPAGPARARVPRAGKTSVSARFDRVFWLGDFNYRVNGNRRIVDQLLTRRSEADAKAAGWESADECARESLRVLLRNDQLGLQLRAAHVFRGFVEGEIGFRPTYKFDSKHRDAYDLSEKARIPAWTDRILFVQPVHEPKAIMLHYYSSIDSIKTSDHRPVLADLSVTFEHDAEVGTHEPPAVARAYTRGGGGRALSDPPKPAAAVRPDSSAFCAVS